MIMKDSNVTPHCGMVQKVGYVRQVLELYELLPVFLLCRAALECDCDGRRGGGGVGAGDGPVERLDEGDALVAGRDGHLAGVRLHRLQRRVRHLADLLHRADLQQGPGKMPCSSEFVNGQVWPDFSPERRPADGAVVRLVAEAVCACVAEAEVAAGQDDGVAQVDHAHHALRPAVVYVVVHVRVRLVQRRLGRLVLQAVDLLQIGHCRFQSSLFLRYQDK